MTYSYGIENGKSDGLSTSNIRLSESVNSILLALSLMLALPLALLLALSDEASCPVLSWLIERLTWQRTEGHLTEKQDFSPAAHEELYLASSVPGPSL